MASTLLQSELQISNIETNKQFCRLADKTQVSFPRSGLPEVVKNRLTHSSEVATSSAIMGIAISERMGWSPLDVDYQGSIKPCALLHDVGHPALGHSGADFLDFYFKEKGLTEGFSDNNNTLTVIDKNNIMVSMYTIASVIKYPDRLYPDQKEKYQPHLDKAIREDQEHFASLGLTLKEQTRTIACQIMDEADRNTYICSDLSDFLCLGHTLSIEALKEMAHEQNLVFRYSEIQALFSIIRAGDKTAIKAYFNNLKNQFNMNYTLTPEGIKVVNEDLHAYREFLWDVEYKHYIHPLRKEAFHLNNMKMLKRYVDKVVLDGFCPSRTYSELVEQAKKNEDKSALLRAQRDMIAEATDWYVTKIHMQAQSADTALNNDEFRDGGVFGANQPHTMT